MTVEDTLMIHIPEDPVAQRVIHLPQNTAAEAERPISREK